MHLFMIAYIVFTLSFVRNMGRAPLSESLYHVTIEMSSKPLVYFFGKYDRALSRCLFLGKIA